MRILVITHSYFPVNDPRAFRWRAICEYWVKQGIVIDVVCAHANLNCPPIEVVNGVTVYRVRDSSQQLRAKNELAEEEKNAPTSSWKMAAKQKLYAFLKKTAILLRWPDFAWFWIPNAYRQAKALLTTNHYDGVYSVALPFSSHIVALCLSKYRKNSPWVTDYGDPFSFVEGIHNNKKIYNRFNAYIEQKVMHASKRISVTTLETAKEYSNYLEVKEAWFKLIPPLVKAITLKDGPKTQTVNPETLQLVFAGTLYSKIRNPRHLLELVEAVRNSDLSRKLILHFYGPINDCAHEFEPYKEAINDWLFIHGTVDKSSLMSIYETADVLVNIGNATTYQAPSKVIEYLSTGLPILNSYSVQKDSSKSMLDSYPAALSIYQERGVTKEVVGEVIEFLEKKHSINSDLINQLIKPYQCETIAASYLELLN